MTVQRDLRLAVSTENASLIQTPGNVIAYPVLLALSVKKVGLIHI